jgi:hypothetical protein
MIRYSGENWQPERPYVAASPYATLLNMNDGEKAKAQRRPIGFAPPMAKRPAGKSRIRPKVR